MGGVLLQGFYKLPPNKTVPSPADGTPGVAWWWDHLAAQAHDLSVAGFTAVWLPPVLKASSGATPGADGYGPFDDYDIGSKKQKGSLPTRYGKRADLLRCAAILRANGLDIYLDMVEHHRSGDGANPPEAFVFRYLGANGTPGLGRFPKDPGNFLPQVPRDPHLGGAPKDDLPFGRELAPINAKPPRYVFDGLIMAGDWLTRTVGAQGYRLDDVKGLSTDFLLPFLNGKSMQGKFAVGEFFDGNAQLIKQWIFNPQGMQGRVSAFDFPLKFMLTSMCNNPGRFNMADLDHAGLTGIAPLNSVTFVENHDTDLKDGQRIVVNKLLAYAYILTSEGYPSVFYKDYSTDPGCYGLKPQIDNLIWVHDVLANGATEQRWKDFNVFAFERTGNPRLLVALNNDPANTHTIQLATSLGGNVHLKDYTGHGPDVFTDGRGNVSVTVPRNKDGLGYVCYSQTGQDRTLAPLTHPAVQDIEGSLDLDVLPAINGSKVNAGRIWCSAGSPVQVLATFDQTGWGTDAKVDVSLVSPGGVRSTVEIKSTTNPGAELRAHVAEEGFSTLEVAATGLPATNRMPAYKLSITYSAPPKFVQEAAAISAVAGQWEPAFDLENVAIHVHLLPNGKVLYWGRRSVVGDSSFASLNEHFCSTFLWDPDTGHSQPTAQPPRLDNGRGVNLFCSGHCFLDDGQLLVVGGHLFDSEGVDQACLYDFATDTWSALPRMNDGRWYPSALMLPDGGALAISGSFALGRPQPPPDNASPPPAGTPFHTNSNPQIWRDNAWTPTVNFQTLQLYPRLHVEPKQGQVFMAGPQGQSFFLDTQGAGAWTPGPQRDGALRDYAPSVMYQSGKVIYIGGGQDQDTQWPTDAAEIIDLNVPNPEWKATGNMHFRRRQHNATVLPDGTVLVTGGTQGTLRNPQWLAFNNVDPGGPVHQAEIWDPTTGLWTLVGAEDIDRCYHSTALLLPDGRVLSAGGGEYAPNNPNLPGQPNPARDSHKNAQLFKPPYLFKGSRPTIANAPSEIKYGADFVINIDAKITKVSWIRLGSVTHSCNQNQLLIFLAFQQLESEVTITAPESSNIAPPGHYMLFALSEQGVPAVAPIIRIASSEQSTTATTSTRLLLAQPRAAAVPDTVNLAELDDKIIRQQGRPPILVGITPSCPYGIGACWGGAFEALQRLSNVEVVRPVPDTADSIAFVYLQREILPDLDAWRDEFAKVINGTYLIRGLEMTLTGSVVGHLTTLTLSGTDGRPNILLAPLQAADKVQWDIKTRESWPLSADEANAYTQLSDTLAGRTSGVQVQVTGPLKKNGTGFFLEVRTFVIGPP